MIQQIFMIVQIQNDYPKTIPKAAQNQGNYDNLREELNRYKMGRINELFRTFANTSRKGLKPLVKQ
jgi:hypothetical protein